MPRYWYAHMLLATIYGALGRTAEAQPAIANLIKLYPGYPEKMRNEARKWNTPEDIIDRYAADLRTAGLAISAGR